VTSCFFFNLSDFLLDLSLLFCIAVSSVLLQPFSDILLFSEAGFLMKNRNIRVLKLSLAMLKSEWFTEL